MAGQADATTSNKQNLGKIAPKTREPKTPTDKKILGKSNNNSSTTTATPSPQNRTITSTLTPHDSNNSNSNKEDQAVLLTRPKVLSKKRTPLLSPQTKPQPLLPEPLGSLPQLDDLRLNSIDSIEFDSGSEPLTARRSQGQHGKSSNSYGQQRPTQSNRGKNPPSGSAGGFRGRNSYSASAAGGANHGGRARQKNNSATGAVSS